MVGEESLTRVNPLAEILAVIVAVGFFASIGQAVMANGESRPVGRYVWEALGLAALFLVILSLGS